MVLFIALRAEVLAIALRAEVLAIALRAEVLAIALRAEALVIALRAMVPAYPLAQLRQQRGMGCAGWGGWGGGIGWRSCASSGSWVARARSSISTWWACRLPPAAPTVMCHVPAVRAHRAMVNLAWTWSQASMSASTGVGKSPGQFPGATKSSMQATLHAGCIRAIRSRMASTLACPTVSVRA